MANRVYIGGRSIVDEAAVMGGGMECVWPRLPATRRGEERHGTELSSRQAPESQSFSCLDHKGA
jgi:hypothetical protein